MRYIVFAAAILFSTPAQAEVLHAAPTGFESHHVLEVPGSPAQAMARFGAIGDWWDPQHTYGGTAKTLRLDLNAGGCFCETLPDGGGVEHMRVVYSAPGKRLTMTGGLGPLLYEATAAVLDVQFTPSSVGSKVTISYRVAGFAKGGAEKLAPLVDRVLDMQFRRYAALR